MSSAEREPSGPFNLSAWAIGQPALIRFLMASLVILGVLSYFQLGQDEDPPFNFRVMVIQAEWPGATTLQMSDQVADRIERFVQSVPDIAKISSFSKPGRTVVIVEVKDNFNPAEVPDRFYTIRKRVTDAAGQLPQGVRGPFFNDDFGDTFGVLYALSAPGLPQAELADLSKSLRSSFLKVKDVGKVEVYGLEEERVFVELSRRALARYRLAPSDVAAQLSAQNAVVESGRLQSAGLALPIEVSGAFQGPEDIAALPIRAPEGLILRLGDLGEVRRGLADPPATLTRFNGEPVVVLGISMRKGGDVIALGQALTEKKQQLERDLPVGVRLEQVQDQPAVVASSVNEFLKVLAEAVGIVLGVSLLALGLHTKPLRIDPRPGLIVAISIPLVLGVTFLIMYLTGVGIHKISLGSLIIALGLLVDDAIIVVEMMVRKLEEGADRLSAVTAAYRLTAMPMLTGTLITAVGFLPIGIAKSVVGEYTFAIFAVTSAALLVSWLVSVIFVPVLGYWMLKVPRASAHGHPDEVAASRSGFLGGFRRLVELAVAYRWITLLLTLVIFAAGLAGMAKVEKQFFPDSSRPEILVDVTLPEGSNIRQTESAVRAIEEIVLAHPEVASANAWIGTGAPRFFLPLDVIFPQENVAQLIVLPKDPSNRRQVVSDLQRDLALAAPQARIRVKVLPNGPPVPFPVMLRVLADRPDQVQEAAARVEEVMRAHPDARGVHNNWNQQRPIIRVEVDAARARESGVSPQSVAQTLGTLASGAVIGQYREDDKLIPIELRLPTGERDELEDLQGLLLPTTSGQPVSLDKVATVRMVWEPGIVWRRDGRYSMTVQAEVRPGRQGPTVTAELMQSLEPVIATLPPGVSLEVGGEVEESGKGQASIFAGMPIMLFLTLMLLVVQLRSNKSAFMVLATAPLGIAGAAAALILLQRPFGFVAMLGVIALMGMIMRNSVILIDQIEKEQKAGLGLHEAIVQATVLRFRPIVLTAAAAVLAMIPLQSSAFWGPMAVAIMGGLIVATFLTLISLPALVAVSAGGAARKPLRG